MFILLWLTEATLTKATTTHACICKFISTYLYVHRVESPRLISVVLKIFERNLMWSVFTLCKLFSIILHVSWSPEWMEEVTCARVRAQHRPPPWQQQAAPTLTKWRGQPGAGTGAALGQHLGSAGAAEHSRIAAAPCAGRSSAHTSHRSFQNGGNLQYRATQPGHNPLYARDSSFYTFHS